MMTCISAHAGSTSPLHPEKNRIGNLIHEIEQNTWESTEHAQYI